MHYDPPLTGGDAARTSDQPTASDLGGREGGREGGVVERLCYHFIPISAFTTPLVLADTAIYHHH
jgi:hypothetical protein